MAGKVQEKKTESKADTPPVDDPDLRNQLAKRLAVAGGLVAILLGVLGLFDYFSQPSEETDLPVFTQPVPVAPRKMVTQPVTPAEPLPDDPVPVTDGQLPAVPGAPAAPVVSAAEVAPPPPPVVAAVPAAEMPRAAPSTAKPATRPAPAPSSSAAVASPKAPAAAVVPEMTSPPPIAPEMPRQMAASRPAETPPAQKTVRVLESTPPAVAPPRLFSGFVLQAGVFTSAQRAEELHARLTLSGVPSSIESRVQVGPFKTRQEAAAAQAKLRELGIETLLVPPTGSR
jgi:DedD protein